MARVEAGENVPEEEYYFRTAPVFQTDAAPHRWLAEHHPAVKVIMLTMSEDHDTALTALRDGALALARLAAEMQRLES